MDLRSKQVSGDPLQRSASAEQSKPPCTRRTKPQQQQSESLNCPRCGSTNTKFCYYNNYSKSQPRHFCKSCKRHWTEGGTLRNVPVGGVRNNKSPRTSNNAAAAAAAAPTTVPTTAEPRHQDRRDFLHQNLSRSSPPLLHKTAEPSLGSDGIISASGLNEPAPQNPNTQFPFSDLSTFDDENTSFINPTSFQFLTDHIDHHAGSFESMEESTITALDIPTTSSTAPWMGPDTSGAMDWPNYWNWNEIDVSTGSADVNAAWDDVNSEIKP